jgi:aliphatic sulfonates family ABC transporter substrate-binding protein
MNIKKTLAVTVALISVGAGYVFGGAKADQKATAPSIIRVGDIAGYEIIKIADEKGFFNEEFEKDGIEVQIYNFLSGPPEIEALSAKNLDLALMGDQPAVQGISNKIGIHIISGVSDGTEGNGLIVRTDSGINSIADLKGKRVAVPVGTTAHQTLIRMLEKNGLTVADIELVNLGAGDIPTSIQSGNIQAAVAYEPGLTNAEKTSGGAVKKLASAAGYKQIMSVFVARDGFAAEYPELVTRFLKAIRRAVLWRNDNFEESLAIMAKRIGLDPEILRISLELTPPKLALNEQHRAAILETSEYLYKNGITAEKITPTQAFEDKYAKEAGIYDGNPGY